jgi:CRP/FNR family cyclic AMP-dependent transcriptional regulator
MNLSEKNNANPSSELEQNLNLLRQTYFFSGIPLEALKVFAYLCNREKFKKGEYIFLQHEDDGQAYYIIEGRAVLEREQNGTPTIIRDCRSGEFLGGLTLLGEMQRLFSLKAAEDTTCLILKREKFTKTLEQFPGLLPKILKAVVGHIDNWERHFLAHRADKCGDCLDKLGVSLL